MSRNRRIEPRKARRPASSGQQGYGLTDLVLVLALATVLATVVVTAATSTLGTYERNAAAREVLSELRKTQQLAISRGGTFALQWGSDPTANKDASQYRIVEDTTGSCQLSTDTLGTKSLDANLEEGEVLAQKTDDGWSDLSDKHEGLEIHSIVDGGGKSVGGVMFNAIGASVNTCTSVSFPVVLTVADGSGVDRQIEIHRAGSIRLR